jgi:hypothetical protein
MGSRCLGRGEMIPADLNRVAIPCIVRVPAAGGWNGPCRKPGLREMVQLKTIISSLLANSPKLSPKWPKLHRNIHRHAKTEILPKISVKFHHHRKFHRNRKPKAEIENRNSATLIVTQVQEQHTGQPKRKSYTLKSTSIQTIHTHKRSPLQSVSTRLPIIQAQLWAASRLCTVSLGTLK